MARTCVASLMNGHNIDIIQYFNIKKRNFDETAISDIKHTKLLGSLYFVVFLNALKYCKLNYLLLYALKYY